MKSTRTYSERWNENSEAVQSLKGVTDHSKDDTDDKTYEDELPKLTSAGTTCEQRVMLQNLHVLIYEILHMGVISLYAKTKVIMDILYHAKYSSV